MAVEKLPARLQELLMGHTAGDAIHFQPDHVAAGDDELQAFLKNPLKQGPDAADKQYIMTINEVAVLIPHELDINLYMQVFPNEVITTEKDFKDRISKELGKEFERIAADRLHNEMYELLVHNTPIHLPIPFLKRWLKEGGEKLKTDQEVEQEFGGFEHQLRWTLISDKLIIDNDIRVSRDEVMNDIKGKVLAYFGMDADEDAPWIDSYMAKATKEEKTMDETYRRLLFGKLFSYLETKFDLEHKDVTEEEFFKTPDAHAHHHH